MKQILTVLVAVAMSFSFMCSYAQDIGDRSTTPDSATDDKKTADDSGEDRKRRGVLDEKKSDKPTETKLRGVKGQDAKDKPGIFFGEHVNDNSPVPPPISE